jgi:alpha-beta hydrolase superfamily lysophospholipase
MCWRGQARSGLGSRHVLARVSTPGPLSTSHAEAVAAAFATEARAQGDLSAGLDGFHRGYGQLAAVQSGLLKMWVDYEDQLTAFVAAEAGTGPTPRLRL